MTPLHTGIRHTPICVSRDELRHIISDGVREALLSLGIDAKDPLQTQADLRYLRNWRISVETAKSKGLLVAVGILVTGAIGAFILGLKSLF